MYSSKEDIKCDNIEMSNHNDFVKALSTTIEKYVNRHVEERVSKYEDYDKIIELIHGLPIIQKKQRKIEKLKKKIRKLKKIIDENSENIKLVIEEKKEIIDLTNDISDDEKQEIVYTDDGETRLKKQIVVKLEDEDKNSFECDDCNKKGGDCFEEIGISKDEYNIYIDLGEPDRCEDCFNKWKESDDASEYIDKINNEEEEAEEEEAEEEEEEAVEEEEAEEEEEEAVEEEEAEEEKEAAEEEEEEEAEEEEEEAQEEAEEEAQEEAEEEEEEEAEEEAEEEEEVFEIEIDDITYYTSDIENGKLYKNDDGEVGDEVGHLKDGEAYFDNE